MNGNVKTKDMEVEVKSLDLFPTRKAVIVYESKVMGIIEEDKHLGLIDVIQENGTLRDCMVIEIPFLFENGMIKDVRIGDEYIEDENDQGWFYRDGIAFEFKPY